MPRLIGVRVLCEGCNSARAITYHITLRQPLCSTCHRKNSSPSTTTTNKKSKTVDLTKVITSLVFCNTCDNAPAIVFCERQGVALCSKCEQGIHRENVEGRGGGCGKHTGIVETLSVRTLSLTGRVGESKEVGKDVEEGRGKEGVVRKRRRSGSCVDNEGIYEEMELEAMMENHRRKGSKSEFQSTQDFSDMSADNESLIAMDLSIGGGNGGAGVSSDLLQNGFMNFGGNDGGGCGERNGSQMALPSDNDPDYGDDDFTNNYLHLPAPPGVSASQQSGGFAVSGLAAGSNGRNTAFGNQQGQYKVDGSVAGFLHGGERSASTNNLVLNSAFAPDQGTLDPSNQTTPYDSYVQRHSSLDPAIAAAMNVSREMDAFLRINSLAQQEHRVSMQANVRTRRAAAHEMRMNQGSNMENHNQQPESRQYLERMEQVTDTGFRSSAEPGSSFSNGDNMDSDESGAAAVPTSNPGEVHDRSQWQVRYNSSSTIHVPATTTMHDVPCRTRG
eukprot:Plantae.Rhodophyta-Hildenbrandia_rubra.ctg6752.p3 GENE.Plantae.Rhodophyta-Hildenbrandia_rubra.ctg6752~~Plantae.Rhodophyta-Hildenbrandia_rubra.ctg6752.p3  ORF type:complete len:502 (-),score=102.15 Plantae.Rhodophyta-Hildenbrandia_rubra.ctg6752:4476-5981(-)